MLTDAIDIITDITIIVSIDLITSVAATFAN